jgi:hypothetical protein
MDPNANLQELYAYAARIIFMTENGGDEADLARVAKCLAENFLALDDWIANGGFLPSAWQR